MKNKISAFMNLSFWRFLWMLFCGLMVVLLCSEIWNVKSKPAEYAPLWGAEGPVAGLWYYASEKIYLLDLVILIIWFLAGISLCLGKGQLRRKLLLAHFGLTALWQALVHTAIA